ncbi:MAG: hypothetical protein KDA96_16025 [Planctomycetaceae bacterium]|nr:hypothetical protein [Planctomycetaceae bacterium]
MSKLLALKNNQVVWFALNVGVSFAAVFQTTGLTFGNNRCLEENWLTLVRRPHL